MVEVNGLPKSGSNPKHAVLAEAFDREIRRFAPGMPIMAVTELIDRFQVSNRKLSKRKPK